MPRKRPRPMATQRRAALKQKMKQKSAPKRNSIDRGRSKQFVLGASAFLALNGLIKPTQEGAE